MSTIINEVNLILVLCAVSLLVTFLLIRVISAIIHLLRKCMLLWIPYYVSPFSPIQGERGSELKSVGVKDCGLEDVCEEISLESRMTD